MNRLLLNIRSVLFRHSHGQNRNAACMHDTVSNISNHKRNPIVIFNSNQMKNSFLVPAILVLFLIVPFIVQSQGVQKKVVLNWGAVQPINTFDTETVQVLTADGLTNDPNKDYTPVFTEVFNLPQGIAGCDILVTHTLWEPINETDLSNLTFPLQYSEVLNPVIQYGTAKGLTQARLSLVPVVKNPEGGLMRLNSFVIDVVYMPSSAATKSTVVNYAPQSKLATGNWYKVKLNKTGIYKLTYSEMQAMGIPVNGLNPDNIRVFGYGGGMLPEANSISRFDDMHENAIKVVTAKSGSFASGDYILFYATAPDKITFNKTSKKFEHERNIYSDYSYYYINVDSGPGLRIEDQAQSPKLPNYTSAGYFEGNFHEKDLLNFVKSGKQWVGERMDASNPTVTIPEYTFKNLLPGKQAWLRYRLTARTPASASFKVYVNDKLISSPTIAGFQGGYQYATEKIEIRSFVPETDKVRIKFEFFGGTNATAWLDWVEINTQHSLVFTGGQMPFSDLISIGIGNVTNFQITNSNPSLTVWDVTSPTRVFRVDANNADGICSFIANTDSLRQFLAFDNTSYLTPVFAEKTPNQNLHGIASTDMLIVTHKDYISEANRIAEFHRQQDGLDVVIVTNEQIYNEFSSGSPDASAIRDFARMLYKRPSENKLKYLLLFGDGSYDYKDIHSGNTNRILTFQTLESMNSTSSYQSDDFYGLLDDNEGYDAFGLIDIGIGRFPVSNKEEAKNAVDKTIFYATNQPKSLGDWRNKICLIADDEDGNTHLNQVEDKIVPKIESKSKAFNLEKIYLDAYKQLSVPGGQRYPDVNIAIAEQIESGALLIGYTGHGGELSWASEGILTVREINSWTNGDKLPVFMTATCEFSRFDDPERVSAGEYVFLNPLGGGAALFTTTRLANAGVNIGLTVAFYDTLFSKTNGIYPRFGDVIAYAKNLTGGQEAEWVRNFVLLGDPALRLACPKYNVVTTEINGKPLSVQSDTISAMSQVEIKGMVTDFDGQKLSSFNGEVNIKIFDKFKQISTLENDPESPARNFKVQDNIIYQGISRVTNGEFFTRFIVPRDIDYSFGNGKISYYAQNGKEDAHGYTSDLLIGGSGVEGNDNTGPQIKLYIDNISFVDGGSTSPNPVLLAFLDDESGINTTGNGIGHDIVATLDNDIANSFVLNKFYRADLDSYTSGVVTYKFSGLSVGMHTLELKVWDVYNNSSTATITFEVKADFQVQIVDITTTPNPFSERTEISFNLNMTNEPIVTTVEVFNINGSLLRTLGSKQTVSQGTLVGPIEWDGLDAFGNALSRGVYILSVRVQTANSETIKGTRVLKIK